MAAMPTWEQFMVPVLRVLSDGQTRPIRSLRNGVMDLVGLSEAQRAETYAGSGQSRPESRIGFAASYLNRVDALHRPSRGHYAITEIGRQLLLDHPGGITENDLKLLAKDGDEWWVNRGRRAASDAGSDVSVEDSPMDPTEQVEQGVARITEGVAAELLGRLLDQDAGFFEHAVVELLLAMGYGGVNRQGAATQLTRDGGIDGVIDQDRLGLDKVYVQAKRYVPGNSVQRPEVQGFVGALSGKADRGVFITTSTFSAGAREYAEGVPTRLILIDGKRLAELMIEYNVGVQTAQTYRVVEIDEDFFE